MGTLIQRGNGTIVYFDAAESVVRSLPSRATQHPVEKGSVISDHIITDPATVSVNAVISDAALTFAEDDPFSEVKTVSLPDKRLAGGTDTLITRRSPVAGRSLKALQELEQIRNNRETFTLETRDEVFENMVFTAFDIPRDASTGRASRVTFTAQQIQTVQRRFATVPQAVDAGVADKAAENAETGKQAVNQIEVSELKDVLTFFVEQNNPSLGDLTEVLQ